MLGRLFRGWGRSNRPMSYEAAKRVVAEGGEKERLRLSARQDLRPELLYYLASDAAPSVRRAVAGNPATPRQANVLLATDPDDEVRCELAAKIGRLLPDLEPEARARLRELTIETLEILARDQLPRVRAVLAAEIRHSTRVPKSLVLRLARDLEAIVAAPVLEYSPLLSDSDLLEIIASGVARDALPAIARRPEIGEAVSDAIVASLEIPAVAALLANPSARIRTETLDAIAAQAEGVESWHEPLVMRADLSVRAMRRIAHFVTSSLLAALAERHGLPEDLALDLGRAVSRRLEQETMDQDAAAGAEAASLQAAGRLDEACISAAVEAGRRAFAIQALALRAQLPPAVVRKIVLARSPRGMTALAWKAGLGMRTAVRLQLRLALIPPQEALNARGGTDYPMTQEDMDWQIAYFQE